MSRPDAPPARMPGARLLPSQALIDEGDPPADLPVCDHYCGTEPRMRKALALQAELGPVFDITLDCEDGAPAGRERGFVVWKRAAALENHLPFRAIQPYGPISEDTADAKVGVNFGRLQMESCRILLAEKKAFGQRRPLIRLLRLLTCL